MSDPSTECSHDCEHCSANCEGAMIQPDPCNPLSQVRKVIAIVSGKGGVGKSTVSASLAAAMRQRGRSVGVMDADITGPSIPMMFGVHTRATGSDDGLFPVSSAKGTEIMSLNLLMENENDPVVWRGPVIGGVVKQFWTDVIWGDLDYLFIDMPPGTGDVPLTVFQSIPVDGILVVTSPQDLVSMIVSKAVNMAKLMNIPVLGLIENYSYFTCPDCGKQHSIFGESRIEAAAQEFGVPVLARLPIDPAIAAAADAGKIEELAPNYLASVAELLDK